MRPCSVFFATASESCEGCLLLPACSRQRCPPNLGCACHEWFMILVRVWAALCQSRSFNSVGLDASGGIVLGATS